MAEEQRKPAATTRPAISSAHRPQNPFSRPRSGRSRRSSNIGDRENFPNLDAFLGIGTTTSPPPSRSPSPPDGKPPPFAIQPAASFPSSDEFDFDDHDDGHDDGDGDDTGSSILNMSIGARAALTEHMRHIAKHGIDGEQHGEGGDGSRAEVPKSILDQKWEYFLEQHSDGALLLDVSAISAGGGGGAAVVAGLDTSTDVSFARSSNKRSPLYHVFATNTSSSLEQSIEVMTDISQDFFNSSRVQELVTPERNRDKVHRVSTRDEESSVVDDDDEEDFFIDDDDDEDDNQDNERTDTLAPELLGIHQFSSSSSDEHRYGNNNHQQQSTSFQSSSSFCAPDISRISSADDSESGMIPRHRSPNASFPFHPHLQLLDDEHPHPLAPLDDYDHHHGTALFLQGMSPLQRIGLEDACQYPHHTLDSSFVSLPSMPTTSNIVSSPLETHHHISRNSRTYPTVPNSFREASSFFQQHSLSPARRSHSAPSILARLDNSVGKENLNAAALRQQRRINGTTTEDSFVPSRHQASAFDTLATDFLNAMDRDRRDAVVEEIGALSPISQVGSSHVGILNESSSSSSRRRRLRGGTLRDHRHRHSHSHNYKHGARMVPYPPVASSAPVPAQQPDASTSTSNNNNSSTSSSSSLTGRQRFRTVVPRRVYMGSPSQFPDEHDSFGTSSTNGGLSGSSSNSSRRLSHNNSSSNESPAHRSLLDSFEAVMEGDGEEDEPPISSGCSPCYSNSYEF